MKDWKTTIFGSSAAIMATLTIIASLPYDTGLQALPSEWRPFLIKAGIIATLILRVANAINQKDSTPTPPK